MSFPRASCLVVLLGCSGSTAVAPRQDEPTPLAADLPELEIRADGVDRFKTCPPPGELGQHWIPQIPPWSPPPVVDAGSPVIDAEFVSRTNDRTATGLAVDATHRDFRSCYRQGLVHDPTQDGRVAIVLRVDGAGHVAKVESYGACELDPESISCMYGVARKLRFPPPASGADTITIPATFTSRDGVRRTEPTLNDAYTAGAYVTLDAARARLHACDDTARREGRPVQATGTFMMDVAADGHVTKAHVDPWTGDRSLLGCAAKVLEGIKFAPPQNGSAKVVARLNFNPRANTR